MMDYEKQSLKTCVALTLAWLAVIAIAFVVLA